MVSANVFVLYNMIISLLINASTLNLIPGEIIEDVYKP